MKKIIKLYESDLLKIINKVLSEQGLGRPIPSNFGQDIVSRVRDNITAIQTKLKSLGYNLGTSGPNRDGIDGVYGKMTRNAIVDFQRKNSLTPDGIVGANTAKKLGVSPLSSDQIRMLQKGQTIKTSGVGQKTQTTPIPVDSKPTTPNSGFIIVFAFPEYEPSTDSSWFIDKVVAPITKTIFGTNDSNDKSVGGSSASGSSKGKQTKMGKMGHGGCIIIDGNGKTTLYEFGRYMSNTVGMVKSHNFGLIAKIKNGKLLNARDVAKIAKRKTQGSGPRLAMDCVVLELPDPQKANSFAKVKERGYTLTDPMRGGKMNCGTYSLEVAIEGGVDTSFKCFASPNGVVNHLKPGLESFTI